MVHKRNDDIMTPKGEFGTPPWLFKKLNAERPFDADAAATIKNTKCPIFFTKSMDALSFDWQDMIGKKRANFFLNPDYARGIIEKFVAKARTEARAGATVTCLLPVSSDTKWWHDNVMFYDGQTAVEIRFIEGRLVYVGYYKDGTRIKSGPAFASCIVTFSQKHRWYWNQDTPGDLLPVLGPVIKNEDKDKAGRMHE